MTKKVVPASATSNPKTTASAAATQPAREVLEVKVEALPSSVKSEVIALWSLTQEPRLVFAQQILGPGDMLPVIYTSGASGWSSLSFSDDFHGHAWQGVVSLPKSKAVVAVLDFEVESPGQQLEIFSSRDSGKAWSRATIEKPYYLARCLRIEAFGDDKLRLSVTLDDEYGSGVKAGLYQYISDDQGATWSAPSFSATLPNLNRESAISKTLKGPKDLDALFTTP